MHSFQEKDRATNERQGTRTMLIWVMKHAPSTDAASPMFSFVLFVPIRGNYFPAVLDGRAGVAL